MRNLAIAAIAVAALGALSSGANAAVYNTPNLGPNGLETFTFGDNDLGAAPTFTRSFTFNTTQAGTFSVLFGEVAVNPINNVEFTSATLNGTKVSLVSFLSFPPPGQFVPGGAGEPDIGFLVGLGVGSGDQTLTITGTNGGNGVFSGTASFTPTPVPGPIAGAGLPALFGLAGAALWRRRRQQAV